MNLLQPQVMGILNVTPDSFADGNAHYAFDAAMTRVHEMIAEGATIIDVGGESTRPGAAPVSASEECRRVVPVIEAIRRDYDVMISIDTSKAEVMEQALAAGASMINDVCALQNPGALEVAKACDVPIVLMHMQGEPRTMQANPEYRDVVLEVGDFLQSRVDLCESQGIARERLIIDPGFGFGKTPQHNLSLIKHLDLFIKRFQCPVLIGVSRKSTIGELLNADVSNRLAGSLALTAMALTRGATIIRTHDVKATCDVITMVTALEAAP